ncbi:MAG: hypothetical protein GY715_14950, partial [Planctomycetes bacterium]|nr:hypothetical protein [Planctomycetota bacterium]
MDLHAIRHASRWAACVSLLLMLAIGGAKPAHGAGWDTPVTISDGTPNWLYPRVATRSGPGNYVHVVWRDLAATKVMYRRSADGGRTWFPILTLHTGTVASIGPHIATAGNTVHVVWEGPSSAIKYLRSTNNGGAWDAEVTLSGATTGYTPDIGASVDRVYVAWIKDGAPDIVYVQSQNNGNTWTTPANVTSDGNTTSESDVRVAASGTYAYFAWLQNGNVLFRNKTGVIWGFPITLWVGDSDHVSVAAYNERVFVDRNQAANGPVQRVSANWGGAFSPAVSLGTGDEKPEVSASRAYDGNGATAFLDTRLSVHRIFVSTSVASETQIATITGSSRNTDIGAMHEGSMHVVANSSGERHVYYHRYVAPRDFDWWQQLFGVSKSDVQWTDFDGDGDLDLVLSGDTSGSGNVLVTQTWENTFNVFVPLTLKQDLSL